MHVTQKKSAMDEYECRNDGLRIFRPTDYILLPNCPVCNTLLQPTTKWRLKLRKLLDMVT